MRGVIAKVEDALEESRAGILNAKNRLQPLKMVSEKGHKKACLACRAHNYRCRNLAVKNDA
jgi:hypothetical protein